MISTLLLSLALGVAAQPVARPVITQTDDPAIRIWLNEDGRFQRGDEVKVQVRTRDDEITLFDSTGLAIQDLAIARAAVAEASGLDLPTIEL